MGAPILPASPALRLREHVLVPGPAPRVVGPGRRERAYLRRIGGLEETLERELRELDLAQRVERGCQRRIDRLERKGADDRTRLEHAAAREKRLILALGALQRENELLRERLALAPGRQGGHTVSGTDCPDDRCLTPHVRPAARRRGWLARLLP